LRDLGLDGRIILKWLFKLNGCEDVNWIQPAQDRTDWGTLINTVMNIEIKFISENYLTVSLSRRTLLQGAS
jgi:hypothetical protein